MSDENTTSNEDVNITVKNETESIWKKNLPAIIMSILFVLASIGLAFTSVESNKQGSEILDLKEELAEAKNYQKDIEYVDGFAINEAIRVSGTERIYRALEQEDPALFLRIKEKWKRAQPIVFQKIYIDSLVQDTVFITKTNVAGDTIVVTFDWQNNLIVINGTVYAFPNDHKGYDSFLDMKVTRKPIKLYVTVMEDEKTGELKSIVVTNDDELKIAELDTRIAKDYSLKKGTYWMIGGGLGMTWDFKPVIALYTGLNFSRSDWGLFLRAGMFQDKVLNSLELGVSKNF